MTSLTPADRALELFVHRPAVENPLDWLANQLLALAAETGRLSLRIVPPTEGQGLALECSDSTHIVRSEEPGPLRLFRTLLARLAKMAEEENGAAFNPYEGQLHFNRSRPSGAVCLNVDFENTKRVQAVTLTLG